MRSILTTKLTRLTVYEHFTLLTADADPTFDRGTLDFLILSCIVQLVIILQAIVKDYVLDVSTTDV